MHKYATLKNKSQEVLKDSRSRIPDPGSGIWDRVTGEFSYFCKNFLKMEHLRRNKVCDLLKSNEFGKEVLVKGWVRTRRGNKNVNFIALNDGSIIHSIQVVIEMSEFSEEALKPVTTGACIAVKGILVESRGQGQNVEIQGKEIEIYGTADPETYPLQKKGHSLEFLREIAHLRPRTNTFGAVLRIRHAMAFAIHKYYNDNGFFYLHSPLSFIHSLKQAAAGCSGPSLTIWIFL